MAGSAACRRNRGDRTRSLRKQLAPTNTRPPSSTAADRVLPVLSLFRQTLINSGKQREPTSTETAGRLPRPPEAPKANSLVRAVNVVVANWADGDIAAFAELVTRFNDSAGRPQERA